MATFKQYSVGEAPAGSKPILEATHKAWGVIPNLHATLAESPLALEVHNYLFDAFERSSFTPQERQVALMSISYENECNYCMAGHTMLAKNVGVADDVREDIRAGRAVNSPRLEALHRFAASLVAKKGWVEEAEVSAFMSAGYTKAQVLELLIGVGLKVMASYTNHIAHTPYDAFQLATAWTHPKTKAA